LAFKFKFLYHDCLFIDTKFVTYTPSWQWIEGERENGVLKERGTEEETETETETAIGTVALRAGTGRERETETETKEGLGQDPDPGLRYRTDIDVLRPMTEHINWMIDEITGGREKRVEIGRGAEIGKGAGIGDMEGTMIEEEIGMTKEVQRGETEVMVQTDWMGSGQLLWQIL